ncbi:MAG TPA: molybdopterin-dependent oxidoreductase [Terrimicrobiaceae bacterium]|nr:molybdopterin-dependent oxidoreductase [Terrimicrobiaceae bacterium]
MDRDHRSDLARQLTQGFPRINRADFAGGIPQEMASFPQLRIGKRWLTTPQLLAALVPLGVLCGLVVIALAQYLRTLPSIEAFLLEYPGTGDFARPVENGFPWWLRWQHFLNLFLMVFIMRSGLQILADHPRLYLNGDCTPGTEWFRLRGPVPTDRVWTAKDDSVALPGWLGIPGIRHSIGLARWWHFSADMLWLLNGVIFYILLFSTEQWRRLVPVSWSIFPHALSTAIQYASLNFPAPAGWHHYNGLQMIAYFTTVFVAAPTALLTGLLQAPFIAARFRTAKGLFNRQIARTIHFGLLLYFVSFVVIHAAMVFSTGLLTNLNHITRGVNDVSPGGLVFFILGLGVIVVAWLAATPFTLRYPRVVQHAGRFLTGGIKGLFERVRPVAEFTEKDISPYFWPNGTLPTDESFQKLLVEGFAGFKLRVDGLVENPLELSYQEILAMPRHEQITQHYCIQGWSGIAKWGGLQMSEILRLARPKPEVRFVVFYSFAHGPRVGDGLYYDVHKMAHMEHPNTILAHEMNGKPLPLLNGAPLRLRNELELGFKQVKWVQAIEFVESFREFGSGEGGFNEDHEFFGYRAPI